MPFRVVNRPARRPQQPAGDEQDKSVGQAQDLASIYSDASSDNGTHTACSDWSIVKPCDESPPHYLSDKNAKSQRVSDEYDPYATENAFPASNYPPSIIRPLLGTVHQLANALGPDNTPQTTEIDTIPCAGVRIPQGPLLGLLAWRLVVSVQGSEKRKGKWWEDEETTAARRRRRGQSMRILPRLPNKPLHSHSYSECTHPLNNSLQSFATRSHPHLEALIPLPSEQKSPTSLVSNFLLDTSLPYSLISRDTLLALGYPLSEFPRGSATHSGDERAVTLSIQGVSTRLRIANYGEASRLGVQFLHDAGVSVFFPRNGVGVGPVLYRMCNQMSGLSTLLTISLSVESARIVKDVPTTLPDTRERKLTLQQRVRALFGLAP